MSTTPVSDGRTRDRAVAVLTAVLAAALIRLVAGSVLDVDVRVPDGPGSTTSSPLPLVTVIVAVAVVAFCGWGLLALLERFSRRGRTVWSVVACGILLLSLVAPLFAAGLQAGSRITLVCLHVAVAAILIPLCTRGSRGA